MGVRAVATATKFGQKIALISSLKEIEKSFACTVGISELVNFNTLSEFKGAKGVAMAPNLNKNKHNCTDYFSSVQEIEDFFTRTVRFSGSANSNMLSKISREPRELPRQLN